MAIQVTSHRLADFWGSVLNPGSNAMLCVLGDSKSTDASTASNLPYGLQASLESQSSIVARSCRVGGLNSGLSYAATLTTAGGSITQATIQSDQTVIGQQCPAVLTGAFSAGSIWATNSNPSPIGSCCVVYTGNQSWSATSGDWKAVLANLSGYAAGDWTSSQNVMARVLYYRHSGGVTTNRFRTTRAATVNNTTVDMSGTASVQYVDIDCGNGAGAPDVRMIPDGTVSPDADETGKAAVILGCIFYQHASTVPTPGIGIMDASLGGHTSTSLLGALGGGASPTSVAARVQEWFNAMRIGKRYHFIIDIGQNAATNETSELNAGTVTTYKANIVALVNRARAIAPDCKILLCNPYATAYTTTNNDTKGLALLAVAREMGCSYWNGYRKFGRPVSGNAAITTDGIHPTNNGAATWGACMVNDGKTALEAVSYATKRIVGGG